MGSADSYFKNDLKIKKFDNTKVLKQLRDKIDPKDWTQHRMVAVVNAFYNFNQNSIILPAGILQGNFYNSQLPCYVNFGAIGSTIGHELTHGFDNIGRTFDWKGQLTDWWQKSTSQ